MYQILPRSTEEVVGIRIHDRLTAGDIERLRHWVVPYARRFGPLNLLLQLETIENDDYRIAQLWEQIASAKEAERSLERIAMVGAANVPVSLGQVARNMTEADVRCFDKRDVDLAWTWLKQDEAPHHHRRPRG